MWVFDHMSPFKKPSVNHDSWTLCHVKTVSVPSIRSRHKEQVEGALKWTPPLSNRWNLCGLYQAGIGLCFVFVCASSNDMARALVQLMRLFQTIVDACKCTWSCTMKRRSWHPTLSFYSWGWFAPLVQKIPLIHFSLQKKEKEPL